MTACARQSETGLPLYILRRGKANRAGLTIVILKSTHRGYYEGDHNGPNDDTGEGPACARLGEYKSTATKIQATSPLRAHHASYSSQPSRPASGYLFRTRSHVCTWGVAVMQSPRSFYAPVRRPFDSCTAAGAASAAVGERVRPKTLACGRPALRSDACSAPLL